MKSKISILVVMMMFVCTVGSASATSYTVDSGWDTFTFGATNSSFSNTLEFHLATAGILTVTDAYLVGDIFKIFSGATLLGTTSAPNLSASATNYPEAAILAGFSHASFNLSAGDYTISGIVASSPYNEGGAYWKVDSGSNPVPEPSTLILLGAGLLGAGFLRKKVKK